MYVINYTPGAAWIAGQSISDQPLMEHSSYLQQLFDEQRLLFAGPFLDNAGGMAIISVQNEVEAQAIVNCDPAVVNQIFQASLHPWLTLFDSHAGKSLKSRSANEA
ncbi:MAG: hypothetical protein H0X30_03630 [Anaerolineae bacterium]|nr:hypothetical protein [Anaerolineae bacterium]